MFANIVRGLAGARALQSGRGRRRRRALLVETLEDRTNPVMDQVFDPSGYTGTILSTGVASFNTDQEQAQTFTVGVSGILTQVELYIYKWEGTVGDLVLDIRGTQADGRPTSVAGQQLITTSVPPVSVPGLPGNYAAFFAFDLTPYNVYVAQGESLAAVIHVAPAVGGDAQYQWEGRTVDPYPNGAFYSRLIGNSDWAIMDPAWDLGFRTWVEPAIPQPPVVTLPGGPVNYTEDDAAVVLSPNATVADPDTPMLDGGTLTVSLTANGTTNDRLEVRNQGSAAGQIGVAGGSVTYGGTPFGTFSGGIGTTPLTISLNPSASQAAVEALVRNLTFRTVTSAPVTDTRTIQVVLTDGDGATSDPVTTTVTVTSVNDAPVVSANLGLTVAEGAAGVIGQSRLRASDPDNTAAQLTFTVTTSPAHGTLLLSGNPVTTFTQADINANLLSYLHDGSEPVPDAFSFTVTDGTLTTTTATFNLTVTPVNDPPMLTTNTGLTVIQAGSVAITPSRLAAADPDNTPSQLRYTLTTGPAHGTVRKNGSPVTTFTQAEINAGQIAYQHDGVGTAADGFTFTVTDGNLTTAPATVGITVQPIVPVITITAFDPTAGTVTFTGDGSTDPNDHLELYPVPIGGGLYVLGHNLTNPNLASNTDLDPNTPGDQQLILWTAAPPVITVDLKAGDDILGVELSFGFEALVHYDGGTGRDSFILRSGSPITSPVITWKLTGENTGAVTRPVVDGPTPDEPVIDFTGTEDLTGSDGNDPFVFQPGAAFGRIDGGDGVNTLDYSALATPVEVYLPAGAASLTGGVAGFRVIKGGTGNDVVVGDNGGVVLLGGAGDDVLLGGGGDDVLTGGAGNDVLVGGGGFDQVKESMLNVPNITLANTSLNGGADTGMDMLSGIEGADLHAGIGNNVINAKAFTLGPVTLDGGAGDDKLYGGTQGDLLIGGNGKDKLFGGAGNDTFTGGAGNDFLNGGPGDDSVQELFISGTDVVLTTGRLRFKNLVGGTDTLISINRAVLGLAPLESVGRTLNAAGFGAGPVTLTGGAGNDTLIGTKRAGDLLVGGQGDDTFNSGSGADTVDGGAGTDVHLDLRGSALGDTEIDVP